MKELRDDGSCVVEVDRYSLSEEAETFTLSGFKEYERAVRCYNRRGTEAPKLAEVVIAEDALLELSACVPSVDNTYLVYYGIHFREVYDLRFSTKL